MLINQFFIFDKNLAASSPKGRVPLIWSVLADRNSVGQQKNRLCNQAV